MPNFELCLSLSQMSDMMAHMFHFHHPVMTIEVYHSQCCPIVGKIKVLCFIYDQFEVTL